MDIMDQDVSEVRYKLRKGWSPDRIVSGKGITPLMAAVKSKNLEILETLVAAKANLEQDDLLGQTPLHMAVMDAEVQLVKCLLDNGAKVNRQESWGGTALHLAVGGHKKEHLLCLQLLIEAGGDIDLPDFEGMAPVDVAIQKGILGAMMAVQDGEKDIDEIWRDLQEQMDDCVQELGKVELVVTDELDDKELNEQEAARNQEQTLEESEDNYISWED